MVSAYSVPPRYVPSKAPTKASNIISAECRPPKARGWIRRAVLKKKGDAPAKASGEAPFTGAPGREPESEELRESMPSSLSFSLGDSLLVESVSETATEGAMGSAVPPVAYRLRVNHDLHQKS